MWSQVRLFLCPMQHANISKLYVKTLNNSSLWGADEPNSCVFSPNLRSTVIRSNQLYKNRSQEESDHLKMESKFGDSLKYSRMLHSPSLLKNATKCLNPYCKLFIFLVYPLNHSFNPAITLFSIWNCMHQWWLSASFLQWTLCHFGHRIATTWLTRLLAWRCFPAEKPVGKTCLTQKKMQQKKRLVLLGFIAIQKQIISRHHLTTLPGGVLLKNFDV